MSQFKHPCRNPDAAFKLVDGEAMIVLPEDRSVKVLNATGARIWELMDGKHDVEQICSIITTEFDVSPEDALQDLQAFLRELQEQGMTAGEGQAAPAGGKA